MLKAYADLSVVQCHLLLIPILLPSLSQSASDSDFQVLASALPFLNKNFSQVFLPRLMRETGSRVPWWWLRIAALAEALHMICMNDLAPAIILHISNTSATLAFWTPFWTGFDGEVPLSLQTWVQSIYLSSSEALYTSDADGRLCQSHPNDMSFIPASAMPIDARHFFLMLICDMWSSTSGDLCSSMFLAICVNWKRQQI